METWNHVALHVHVCVGLILIFVAYVCVLCPLFHRVIIHGVFLSLSLHLVIFVGRMRRKEGYASCCLYASFVCWWWCAHFSLPMTSTCREVESVTKCIRFRDNATERVSGRFWLSFCCTVRTASSSAALFHIVKTGRRAGR